MNGPLPISINFPFRSSKRQEFQVRFRSCKHRDIKEEANFLVTFKSFHRLLGAFSVGILKVELKILKYLILSKDILFLKNLKTKSFATCDEW